MGNNSKHRSESPITRFQAVRYLFPLIVLGLGVHLILPQITTLEHSYQVIKAMLLWAVALAVTAQIASYLGSGYLLKTLVDLSGSQLSIWRGTLITLAGASFGMVAGGMVGSATAIYRWMQQEQVKPEAATLAGTIPGLFNNIVLVAVSLAGLVHLLLVHQLTRLQGISFAVILAVLLGLIGLLVWGLRERESLRTWVERLARRWAKIRRREYQPGKTDAWLAGLFNAADLLLSGGWRGPLLGAALNVTFDMLTLYFLFIAAGNRISFGVLLTGYGLPLLLGKMAFMVPGGVGVIESTMAGLYTGLGVPDAVTVVVVLVYRVLSFWLPLLLGFPLIMVLQRRASQQVD
jgi:uncharacterized protein (TIRG00374 family)